MAGFVENRRVGLAVQFGAASVEQGRGVDSLDLDLSAGLDAPAVEHRRANHIDDDAAHVIDDATLKAPATGKAKSHSSTTRAARPPDEKA